MKRIVFITLVLMLFAVLVSCGGKATTTTADTTTATTAAPAVTTPIETTQKETTITTKPTETTPVNAPETTSPETTPVTDSDREIRRTEQFLLRMKMPPCLRRRYVTTVGLMKRRTDKC